MAGKAVTIEVSREFAGVLERAAAWKALESFAEYGSWHEDRVTWALTRLITTAPGWDWHGYHVSAVDDTKKFWPRTCDWERSVV